MKFCALILCLLLGCAGSSSSAVRELDIRIVKGALSFREAEALELAIQTLFQLPVFLSFEEDDLCAVPFERWKGRINCFLRFPERNIVYITPPLIDVNGTEWLAGEASGICERGVAWVSVKQKFIDADTVKNAVAHEVGHLLGAEDGETEGLMRPDPYNSEFFMSEKSLSEIERCRG